MNSYEPNQPMELTYIPEWNNGKPFIIHDTYEALAPYAETLKQQDTKVVAPKPLPAPKAVEVAAEPYINLADLSDRQIARMSMAAIKYDIRTRGRNQEYRRFKARVAEEQDVAMDMRLGIIQSIHCRLHEKQIARARGIVVKS